MTLVDLFKCIKMPDLWPRIWLNLPNDPVPGNDFPKANPDIATSGVVDSPNN